MCAITVLVCWNLFFCNGQKEGFFTGPGCLSNPYVSFANCSALQHTQYQLQIHFMDGRKRTLYINGSLGVQYVSFWCPSLTLFNSYLSAYSIYFPLAYIMYNYLCSALLKVLHFNRFLLIFSCIPFPIFPQGRKCVLLILHKPSFPFVPMFLKIFLSFPQPFTLSCNTYCFFHQTNTTLLPCNSWELHPDCMHLCVCTSKHNLAQKAAMYMSLVTNTGTTKKLAQQSISLDQFGSMVRVDSLTFSFFRADLLPSHSNNNSHWEISEFANLNLILAFLCQSALPDPTFHQPWQLQKPDVIYDAFNIGFLRVNKSIKIYYVPVLYTHLPYSLKHVIDIYCTYCDGWLIWHKQ